MTTTERKWIGRGRADVYLTGPDGPLLVGRIYQRRGCGWSWRTADGYHGTVLGDYLDAEQALTQAAA